MPFSQVSEMLSRHHTSHDKVFPRYLIFLYMDLCGKNHPIIVKTFQLSNLRGISLFFQLPGFYWIVTQLQSGNTVHVLQIDKLRAEVEFVPFSA